jgi:4-amino-4-deoxy-L-arabinose transferase-like glycosyltransferase
MTTVWSSIKYGNGEAIFIGKIKFNLWDIKKKVKREIVSVKNHEPKKRGDGFSIDATFLKKIKWSYVILVFILLVGFYGTFFLPNPLKTPGRVYNIDIPSIGYHNMKENEYLSQALNQWNYGDYFRRRMHIFGLDSGPGYFEEYPQMPLLPWMIVSVWTLTGVQFWSARLIIILFSVATIPVLYLLVRRLTKDNDYIALTAAFIFSILPIAVFFGRNIQPEAPALFFLVLGLYFYAKWIDDFKTTNIVFCGLALMMCAQFKPTFLIGMIPMLFIFPYSEIIPKFRREGKEKEEFVRERKKTLLQLVYFAACFLPYFIWNWITAAFLNTKETLFAGTSSRIDVFSIFTHTYWAEYWPAIDAYMRDNYGIWFLWLALIGFAFMLIKYKSRLSKFCIGYTIAIIPYGMILANYINQHSYYQMPFVPLLCISSAYCIYTIGMFLKQLVKIKHIQYLALLLLLFTLPSAAAFTNVQYNTIYFGLDVGAGYIKSHTGPYERFFIEGESQTFGVCYNADRRCAGISTVADLKMAEQQLNFTTGFIHVSRGGLFTLNQNPKMLDYIQSNYRITQIGLIPQESGAAIQYIIVQKGGISDLNNLTNNKIVKKQPVLAKTYTTTYGSIPFYTVSE